MSIQDKKYEIDLTFEATAANEGKTLNKPFRTPKGPKKFSVYVKNEKGNVVKVNFGDPNMEIKRDDPQRRKNFRARHNCDNPGPKTKARYWSCRQWRGGKKVEASENAGCEWDGVTFYDHEELLKQNPSLAFVIEDIMEADCGSDDCGCGKKDDCENCEKADCDCSSPESQASAPKPKANETHDGYMSRCEKEGYSEDECMKAHEGHKFNDQNEPHDKKDHAKAGLTEKQKKLPPALQKSILKKQGKAPDKEEKDEKDSKDEDKGDDKKDKSQKGLTEKQKKLPPALQKQILKKQSKGTEDYASLWKNIHNKRERIKKGSGEKMKKKGEKGAPTPEQLERAKSKTKKLEDHVALPVLKQKQIASDYSELWQKINKKEK